MPHAQRQLDAANLLKRAIDRSMSPERFGSFLLELEEQKVGLRDFDRVLSHFELGSFEIGRGDEFPISTAKLLHNVAGPDQAGIRSYYLERVDEVLKSVQFLEAHSILAPDGSPLALSEEVFTIGNTRVRVQVHFAAVETLSGERLSGEEIKRAAHHFLLTHLERGWGFGLVEPLTLDWAVMQSIASDLGWADRFRKQSY